LAEGATICHRKGEKAKRTAKEGEVRTGQNPKQPRAAVEKFGSAGRAVEDQLHLRQRNHGGKDISVKVQWRRPSQK